MSTYEKKYLKYKEKYLLLKKTLEKPMIGGAGNICGYDEHNVAYPHEPTLDHRDTIVADKYVCQNGEQQLMSVCGICDQLIYKLESDEIANWSDMHTCPYPEDQLPYNAMLKDIISNRRAQQQAEKKKLIEKKCKSIQQEMDKISSLVGINSNTRTLKLALLQQYKAVHSQLMCGVVEESAESERQNRELTRALEEILG